ncbi:MAG: hypothetical protein ACRCXT_04195 [Paraclostridium sp.]
MKLKKIAILSALLIGVNAISASAFELPKNEDISPLGIICSCGANMIRQTEGTAWRDYGATFKCRQGYEPKVCDRRQSKSTKYYWKCPKSTHGVRIFDYEKKEDRAFCSTINLGYDYR